MSLPYGLKAFLPVLPLAAVAPAVAQPDYVAVIKGDYDKYLN